MISARSLFLERKVLTAQKSFLTFHRAKQRERFCRMFTCSASAVKASVEEKVLNKQSSPGKQSNFMYALAIDFGSCTFSKPTFRTFGGKVLLRVVKRSQLCEKRILMLYIMFIENVFF